MTPLMPKATAVWLIENTTLTFEQIATFCGLHLIEIQALADEEGGRLRGLNPLTNNQLSAAEIKRCETDPTQHLQLIKPITADDVLGGRKTRYLAVAKRGDRPDAIAWFVKFFPAVPDSKICTFLGTTKPTIQAIRNKTHWNSQNIKPRSPVQLGMCSQSQLDEFVTHYNHPQE